MAKSCNFDKNKCFFLQNISGYNEHSQAHVNETQNLNTGKSEEAKLLTNTYVEVIGTD